METLPPASPPALELLRVGHRGLEVQLNEALRLASGGSALLVAWFATFAQELERQFEAEERLYEGLVEAVPMAAPSLEPLVREHRALEAATRDLEGRLRRGGPGAAEQAGLENLARRLHEHLHAVERCLEPLLQRQDARQRAPSLSLDHDLKVKDWPQELEMDVPARRAVGRPLWAVLEEARAHCEETGTPAWGALLLPDAGGGVRAWLSPGWKAPLPDLARIQELATAPFELRDSLASALRALGDELGADVLELFLLDPASGRVVLSCCEGSLQEVFTERLDFAPGEGYPGMATVQAVPLVTRDIPSDPRFLRQGVKAAGFLSFASVPLWGGKGVVGVINAAWRHPDPAVEEAVERLRWAGGPLVEALEPALHAAGALAGLFHPLVKPPPP